MNVIIDRPAAKWLPSRHRFALARLTALLVLSFGSPDRKPEHIILPIDRDQSTIEAMTGAIWVFVTITCYIATALPLALPVALLAAVPLASLAIHVPIVGGGLLLRMILGDRPHAGMISAGAMGMLVIWSGFMIRTPGWTRFVAWFFFLVLACNAVAAVLLWLMRNQVSAAESRCAS